MTHYGVTAADIETTIAATRAALDETAGSHAAAGRPDDRRVQTPAAPIAAGRF